MVTLDELKEERGRVLAQIKRAAETTTVAEAEKWSLTVLKLKRTVLDRTWDSYQDKHAALLAHSDATPDDLTAFDADAIEAAQLYSRPCAILDTHADLLRDEVPPPPPRASEISVPKFGGRYTDWISWRAQFVCKVMDSRLSACDKVDLLEKSLTGRAKSCVGKSERRDADDLKRMWKKLEETYDNKYQIVTEHISSILDLPRLFEPSADAMRTMIDTVDEELRSLKRFNYDTDGWCPLVAVLLLRKLDSVTLEAWNMHKVPESPPSLNDLKKFLEKRVLAIRNTELTHTSNGRRVRDHSDDRRTSQMTSNPFKRRGHPIADSGDHEFSAKRSRAGTRGDENARPKKNAPPCILKCETPHYLWFCKKFKGWTLQERVKFVGDTGLCPCCLIVKHASNECKADGCPGCGDAKHNKMLCPKAMVFRSNLVTSRESRSRRGRGSKKD